MKWRDLKVRPLIPGEEDVIASIHNAAFAEWIESLADEYGYHHITPEEVSAWLREDSAKNESLWIAEVNGEAVGYAHCRLQVLHGKRDFKELLFVQTDRDMGQSKIAVVPPHRRQGVAKALIQGTVEHFERLGAEVAVGIAYSDNKAAQELLRRAGFVHSEIFYYRPHSDTEPWRHDTVYAELDLRRPVRRGKLNLKVNVRRAREEDADAVVEIFRRSAPWSDFGPEASREQILLSYLNDAHLTILVAEHRGRVVGVMDFNSSNSRLGIPGVLPEHRNKGIGSTLLYHLLRRMQQRGLQKVIADTGVILHDAIRMYHRFGFEIVRRQRHWVRVLHDSPNGRVKFERPIAM